MFTQPSIHGADQRKHQSSASLAFCEGHQGPVTRKMFSFNDAMFSFNDVMFSFNDVIITLYLACIYQNNNEDEEKISFIA